MFSDPESLQGIRAYVRFADANMPRISELNAAAYGSVAAFGPMLNALRGDAMLTQNRANLAKIETGAVHGDWEPYLATLRDRGVSYSREGMDFTAWSTAFQRMFANLLDFIFAAVPDREEVRVMLKGTAELFDIIVMVVGQTFFDAQATKLTAQARMMREISTPILLAEHRLLLVPLIGELDDDRMRALTAKLLGAIRAERARAVVMDLTGVPAVDSNAMGELLRLTAAAGLMGARVVLSGLAPAVCQSLVTLGVALPSVETVATLNEALETARADVDAG